MPSSAPPTGPGRWNGLASCGCCPPAACRPVRYHRIHVMRCHLSAREHVLMDWAPALYRIRVDGHLGAMALSAFPGMRPRREGSHTVLTGRLDQSALHGML